MMQITKPVSFENVVSMEDLSAEDVMSFIHEAIEFKQGKQVELARPVYAPQTCFLKAAHGPIPASKWQNASLAFRF